MKARIGTVTGRNHKKKKKNTVDPEWKLVAVDLECGYSYTGQ